MPWEANKMIPFLTGDRVYLRALEEDDVDGGYPTWLNDEEVCRGNSHHRYPYTREAAVEWVQQARSKRDSLVLAIVASKDDTHIGNIELKRIDPVYRSAEFAILTGEKSFWGQGYSREAAKLLVDHGFFTLNLNRIDCGTFETNTGMRKLAGYLGMREEGRRRQAVFKQNRWIDVIEFGLLRSEYLEHFSGGEPGVLGGER